MGLERDNVQPKIEGFDVFKGMEEIEIAHVGLEKTGGKSSVEISMENIRFEKRALKMEKSHSTVKYRRMTALVVQIDAHAQSVDWDIMGLWYLRV